MRVKLAVEAVAFCGLVVLVAVLPRLVSDFHARELANIGALFIALVGLAILTGYSGQVSLGHGAFMAIGGYTTAILTVDHGVRDLWTIPIAGLVAGCVGLLVGIPALRLSGLYLALVTFGIAVAFPQLPKKYGHFAGGTTGIILNLPKSELGVHTSSNRWVYDVTWVCALLLLVCAWIMLRGKPGRTWQAIRDSEVAAASSGVNVAKYKAAAFGISAFYAGVAGSLYAIPSLFVNPDSFPIALSIFLVAGLAVGGTTSLLGLLGGAAFVYYLHYRPDLIASWANHIPGLSVDPKQSGTSSLVFGVALVAVMLLLPTGVGGLLSRALRPLTSRLYTRA
jgi:branched-chain amino acid transport system permease protein